ncbi:hypothetical protein Avbf_12711 [Armadillidium vulgare]|nr:hypothetical protein Avbf_12711 [Armadillidium vulgare]
MEFSKIYFVLTFLFSYSFNLAQECGKRGTITVTTSNTFLAKRSINSFPSIERFSTIFKSQKRFG